MKAFHAFNSGNSVYICDYIIYNVNDGKTKA